MSSIRALVLFDIDGTLVVTGRAGVRGMNGAFSRLYGVANALETVPIAGRTDRAIVGGVFKSIGVPAEDAAFDQLRDVYLEHLREAIEVPVEHPKRVLDGVDALLQHLDSQPGVEVGLLTGNFEGGAEIKLGHFDLWRRFRFGAFGDRHVDRRDLVPLAIARAADAGVAGHVALDRVVVIGDTPLDIDCASAHGARSIAVATGPYDRATLVKAGAGLAVETLGDVDQVGRWIVDGAASAPSL